MAGIGQIMWRKGPLWSHLYCKPNLNKNSCTYIAIVYMYVCVQCIHKGRNFTGFEFDVRTYLIPFDIKTYNVLEIELNLGQKYFTKRASHESSQMYAIIEDQKSWENLHVAYTLRSDGVPFAGDSLERSYHFYDRPSRLSSNAPACRGQSRLSGFCCAHRLCVRSTCQHISRMRTFW